MITYSRLTKAIIFIMAFGVLKGQTLLGRKLSSLPSKEPLIYIDEGKYINTVIQKNKNAESNHRLLEEYAQSSVVHRLGFISKGFELSDWTEAENYVVQLVNLLNKSTNGDSVKVKFVRDPSVNAFAYEDATIFIHIGLMSVVNSEAELAALLAHELAHVNLAHNYSLHKAYRNYLKESVAGTIAGGLTGLLTKKISRYMFSGFSIDQESEADETAWGLLSESSFSMDGAINLLKF